MQNSIRDIYKYLDLYGDSVFITALKSKFKSVAVRDKTIPNGGSPCSPSCNIREDLKVKRAIFHKNNEITVFFNIPGGHTAAARFF